MRTDTYWRMKLQRRLKKSCLNGIVRLGEDDTMEAEVRQQLREQKTTVITSVLIK